MTIEAIDSFRTLDGIDRMAAYFKSVLWQRNDLVEWVEDLLKGLQYDNYVVQASREEVEHGQGQTPESQDHV